MHVLDGDNQNRLLGQKSNIKVCGRNLHGVVPGTEAFRGKSGIF